MHWAKIRLLICAVMVGMLVIWCLPAAAAETKAPPPAVSAQEIDKLVKTLEDPAAREKLVRQLQALKAAHKNEEPEDGRAVSAVLAAMSERVEAFGQQFLEATNVISEAPRFFVWLRAQAEDETARARWFDVISKLLGILVAGLVVEKTAQALLRPARARIASRLPKTAMGRLPLLTVEALVELAPVAIFAAAAYPLCSLLAMARDPRTAALMLVTAYVSARLAMVSAHIVFMPRHAALRLLPLTDETAHYLYLWARRLIAVGIYGYVIVNAASLLGLPKAGYEFLLKVLGLLLTSMAIVLILQNRQAVAAWIASRGGDALDGRLVHVRNRLADVWHILAGLYIAMIYGIWALRVAGGFEFMLRASALTVVTLVAAGFASHWIKRAIERGFAVSQDLRRQFPQLEARANRYLPIVHGVLRVLVAVITLLVLLQVWGVDAFHWLATDFGRRFLSGAVTIAVVLVVALVVWEVVSSNIERYLTQTDGKGKHIERSARARTLLPLLRNALFVLLIIVVGLIVLSELGVNIAPLLAGAGVVGLAVGFGSQKLVQDLITGAFILFENTISVGDVVKLGEHTGTVEALSIRTIRLRDSTGAVHTIPFSSVSTVVNMTKDFSYCVADVEVAYREDTDEVIAVLRAIGADLQADPELGKFVLEPLEVLGVDRFLASSVVIRVRIKTQPGKQWAVGRELNRRVKKQFDALGIEIPFPHQTIYFGEGKDGKAPSLHMQLERRKVARRPPRRIAAEQHGADVQVVRREDEEDEDEMADR